MLTEPATSRFRSIFTGVQKPVIAMAHLPPLPGTPLYDRTAGVRGIVDAVKRDVHVLLEADVDAIMFCNEGDRPYQLKAGPEGAAVLARVVTECAPSDRPYGVDFLWDPVCALGVAVASTSRTWGHGPAMLPRFCVSGDVSTRTT